MRTVRIVNRWWAEPDPGYHGVRIDEVTVPWVCCTCGGPRGEPYIASQIEDGEALWVHRWENPCGHVDKYRAVAAQAAETARGGCWVCREPLADRSHRACAREAERQAREDGA